MPVCEFPMPVRKHLISELGKYRYDISEWEKDTEFLYDWCFSWLEENVSIISHEQLQFLFYYHPDTSRMEMMKEKWNFYKWVPFV